MVEPIIESSGGLSFIIRVRDIVLTILMWLMYIYFMRNFFVFMGDFFAWTFNGFADTDSYPSFRIVGTLINYFKIIVLMGLMFIGWAVYNKVRYGKKRRRVQPLPLESLMVANAYGLKTEDLAAWMDARTMVMHHESDGRLSRVEILH